MDSFNHKLTIFHDLCGKADITEKEASNERECQQGTATIRMIRRYRYSRTTISEIRKRKSRIKKRDRTMPLTDPDVAKEFFIITMRDFEYIWFWMKNYLDIRKSSELRRC